MRVKLALLGQFIKYLLIRRAGETGTPKLTQIMSIEGEHMENDTIGCFGELVL